MNHRSATLLWPRIVLAVILCAGKAPAAPPPDSLHTSRLEIRADIDSAIVYLDTARAGWTPLILEGIPPGTHVLKVLPPHLEQWQFQMVSDTIRLQPEESRMLAYQLRYYLPLRSEPPGAEVYINDSLAGVTPLLVKAAGIRHDTRLTLKMKGFEPASVLPASLAGESALSVALKAGWQAMPEEGSPFIGEHPGWNARRVGLFVSGGVAVLAGIGAAYFKIAADDKQEAFLETGNPAFASERKRLDTWAGISLAFAQAGIMVLSYLLVTE